MLGDVERRVVDKQDRRRLGRPAERVVEPGLPLLAEDALALAGVGGIDGHQADRVVLYRVVKEPAVPGQIGMVAEGGAKRLPVVAIAGDQIERRPQRRQDLAQMRVVLGPAVLY